MQECLKVHPLAIEAALALAELGTPLAEIVAIAPFLGLHSFPATQGCTAPATFSSPHSVCTGAPKSHVAVARHIRDTSSPNGAAKSTTSVRVNHRESSQCENDVGSTLRSASKTPDTFVRLGERLCEKHAREEGSDWECAAAMISRVFVDGHSSSGGRSWGAKQRSPAQPDRLGVQAMVRQSGSQVRDAVAPNSTNGIGVLRRSSRTRALRCRASLAAPKGVSGNLRVSGHTSSPTGAGFTCGVQAGRASKRRKLDAMFRKLNSNLLLLEQNKADNTLSRTLGPTSPLVEPSKPAFDIHASYTFSEGARTPPLCMGVPPQPNADEQHTSPAAMHDSGKTEIPVASCDTIAVATRRLQPQELQSLRFHRGFAWIGLLVSGYVDIAGAAPAEASSSFNMLALMFPGELESVLGSAHALLASGDHVAASGVFQRARSLDPCNVRGMDDYAAALLHRGCHGELRQLARDMAEMDLALPEVWSVMASFWRSRGIWEKAIGYIDRCGATAGLAWA
jgi:hypothetical protein